MFIRLIASVAVIIAATGVDAAQTVVTAHAIDVTLTGVDCGKVSKVSVVVNGNDRDPYALKHEHGDDCHWTGTRPDAFYLYPRRSKFSLRLGGARTDCHYAKEKPGPAHEPIAQLTFRYSGNNARDVNVLARSSRTKPVFLGYVRVVRQDQTVQEESVACEEPGVFHDTEPQTISDVAFGREDLRLQFLTSAKLDAAATGLLVNHSAVLKKKKGNKIALSRDDVLAALRAQTVENKRLVRPRDAPNWYNSDREMLAAAFLAGLEITMP